MAEDNVECITLDSDEADDALSRAGGQPGVSAPQMVRCNMCVDPGLLPVETDMPRHRRDVHRVKLFYCDICNPGERGARGFQNYKDAVKHVAQENGVRSDDKKNIHDMIRWYSLCIVNILCLYRQDS